MRKLQLRRPLASTRQQALALAAILLTAMAVRVAYRVHAGSEDFWQHGYRFFFDIAVNIAAGKGFGLDGVGSAARPPGYPGFLAFAAWAGGDYLLLVIPQAVVGAGTAFCAFLIGNELADRRVGIIAALLTALYPYYVVHDTALQETGLMTFAAALSSYLLLRARRSASAAGWLGAGAVLAASVLIRLTMLPFALSAVVWVVVFGEGSSGRRLRRAGIVLVPVVVAVSAWVARNEVIAGRPVLSSEAGYQFWMAHNPWTFSRYPAESIDRSRDVAVAALTPEERRELEAVSPDEMAASDWFLRKGLGYVSQNPGATLAGATTKLAAGFSWVMSPQREPLVQTIYLLSYGPISVLGFFGMALAWREWRVHSLIYLQFAAFVLVSTIFWAHTSHRSHLDVYLIVFSAIALERVFVAIDRWRLAVIAASRRGATS